MPGLYFKYDVSALKVIVSQDREHIVQFLVRLSSIIAGIVVISGILNSLIQMVGRYLKEAASTPTDTKKHLSFPGSVTPALATNEKGNFLISNANTMANSEFPFSLK